MQLTRCSGNFCLLILFMVQSYEIILKRQNILYYQELYDFVFHVALHFAFGLQDAFVYKVFDVAGGSVC